MSKGYTVAIAAAIKNADPSLIGVELGVKCLDNDVSVTQAAKVLHVTRQTIYAWFTGKTKPKGSHLANIRLFIATLQ